MGATTNALLALCPIDTTAPNPSSKGFYPLRQAHRPDCHVTSPNAFPPPLIMKSMGSKRRAVMSSATNENDQAHLCNSIMFFQAEGTMNEAVIPSVTSALQEMEGISNLNVQVVEGIASVELIKKTTQAAGVASSLVEIIQGLGFKLQTLNLSFEDDEEVLLA